MHQGKSRTSFIHEKTKQILNSLHFYRVVYRKASEIKNVFSADLAIIMLCEIEIFIEISISVRNLFSRPSYNRFWSGALKLA